MGRGTTCGRFAYGAALRAVVKTKLLTSMDTVTFLGLVGVGSKVWAAFGMPTPRIAANLFKVPLCHSERRCNSSIIVVSFVEGESMMQNEIVNIPAVAVCTRGVTAAYYGECSSIVMRLE